MNEQNQNDDDAVRRLKAKLQGESWETNFLDRDLKLLTELEHLEALGKNFPNGCMFRMQIDPAIFEIDFTDEWFKYLQMLYISPSWEQISATPRDDVMRDCTVVITKMHPDDVDVFLKAFFVSLVNCSLLNTELRYFYNTETRWVQVSTLPRRDGHSVVCEGFIYEITAHKTAEQSLKESEIQLAKHRDELELLVKAQTMKIKIAKDDLAVMNEELASANQEMYAINEELQHKNNQLQFEIAERLKHEMELSRYRSNLEQIVQDKTRELTAAKEKAEESDRLKSAFLANMSHEIRTPLNGIASLLSILSEDAELPESIAEYIGLINSNCEQVTRLFNDILDAAKMEAGQMQIRPEPLCIDELIDDVHNFITQYLRSIGKSHISLEKIKDKSIENSIICADPVRLKQILHNLLSNAAKFTEQGYIRTGYRLTDNNMLEFFVEDTGIGIPESHQAIIFQRFLQVDAGKKRGHGGTGLGLAISHGLAQMMGGDMSVKSKEGDGSKFMFSIAYNPCELV